jgi:RNA polymerase sigma-70 factor, ECF subfamily
MTGSAGGKKTGSCRRRTRCSDDNTIVSEPSTAVEDPGAALLALYDSALPSVYGYLLSRCGRVAWAEDLTAEVFLAAVDEVRRPQPTPVSTAWLIGVARHKLADHWRRQAREERRLDAMSDSDPTFSDPWDVQLDALRARDTLAKLPSQHRGALILRYLDDLPVSEVATLLGRTVHSTEGLLVRARVSFRRVYHDEEAGDA